ncbi:MAG: transporter [Rhodospirillales bacterium]|nr:transporter [Rhodospirillales bacterium]
MTVTAVAAGDASPAATALSPGRMRAIALMVATAFFMEQMDSTVLTTALPAIAHDFGSDPLAMNLLLTSYLVGLTAFIPASGSAADRFGARRVFVGAIALFTLASIACSLSPSFGFLVGARFVQGIGGAMMVPVGRLVVLRRVPKSDMVRAMAWVLMPTMIAPIAGPLVGGFLATVLSWRWIFYVNVPVGVIGIAMALWLIRDESDAKRAGFDRFGLILSGLALSSLVVGLELLVRDLVPRLPAASLVVIGLVALVAYLRRARRVDAPSLDLGLLDIATFRIATLGGILFRIGIGAVPFLLPMMLQLGFGLSPLESGAITFAGGVSALLVKMTTVPILRRVGYRDALVWNSVLGGIFLALCAAFSPGWPLAAMYAVLLLGGFVRSLQFNAFGTIAFADIPALRMSSATTLHSTVQQLSSVLGISIAAAALGVSVAARGDTQLALADFSSAFLVVGVLTLAAAPLCARLDQDAGAVLSGQRLRNPA